MNKLKINYFSRNGQILPIDQATIPLSNIHYSYGFGVYETLRVRNGITYFAKQHVQRLLQSAEIIGLTHQFSEKDITKYISDLVNYKKIAACNIKILLIGGNTPKDSQIFILPLSPLFLKPKQYSEGVKTLTVSYERTHPRAKTLNMLESYLAYKKAQEQDCYDALLVDNDGYIREGTRTNFFVIKDNTIFTPPKEKILEGIARSMTLFVAKQEKFTIKEADISPAQLSEYDAAFLTSTTAKILPVRQIDDFIFPQIPDKLKTLMKKYDDFLEKSKGAFS